jgi:hypothetical protein
MLCVVAVPIIFKVPGPAVEPLWESKFTEPTTIAFVPATETVLPLPMTTGLLLLGVVAVAVESKPLVDHV